MQQFQSRYGEPLVRILNNYPTGSPGLVAALEAICQTAETNGHKKAKNELALAVCEGLHVDPPSGLKCLDCHYAETSYAGIREVEAEMEMVKNAKAAGDQQEEGGGHSPQDQQHKATDLSDSMLKDVLSGLKD